MSGILSPVVLAAGEGKTLSVLGNQIVFKALGADTGGHLLVMEFTVPANSAGPRPHIHLRTDEAFYVLDGTVEKQVGERIAEASTGTFVFAPRGVPHRVGNLSAQPARYLALMTPSGLEGWFEDLGSLVQPGMPRPDPAMIAALSDKYDHVLPLQE